MRSISIFACIAVSMVLILGGCSHSSYLEHSGISEEGLEEEKDTAEEGDAPDKGVSSGSGGIFVQVAGAVKSPGVYELAEDARVFEAIKMAGGLNKDADESTLNQAERLTDGQKIYVYRADERQMEEREAGVDDRSVSGSEAGSGQQGQSAGLVNLNTADAGTLMTLSGIGEAKANAIISYREENGGFHSLEELKQVSGIGEATFERLKDSITI